MRLIFCRIFHVSFSSDAGLGALNNPWDCYVNLFYAYGSPNIRASWQILGSPICSPHFPSLRLRLDLSVQTRFSILSHRPTCAYPFWSTKLTKRFGSCHSAPPNIVFCSRRTHEKKTLVRLPELNCSKFLTPRTIMQFFLSKAVL
jgi:hypothetical protein